jgi:hypothetical protein
MAALGSEARGETGLPDPPPTPERDELRLTGTSLLPAGAQAFQLSVPAN